MLQIKVMLGYAILKSLFTQSFLDYQIFSLGILLFIRTQSSLIRINALKFPSLGLSHTYVSDASSLLSQAEVGGRRIGKESLLLGRHPKLFKSIALIERLGSPAEHHRALLIKNRERLKSGIAAVHGNYPGSHAHKPTEKPLLHKRTGRSDEYVSGMEGFCEHVRNITCNSVLGRRIALRGDWLVNLCGGASPQQCSESHQTETHRALPTAITSSSRRK